jgi:SOS regulatory protein LexA
MVTKKQQQVLDFIEKYQKKNKYSPTLEEIQRKFKLASVSTAHYYIQQLKDKKLLSKQESQHRAINVLPANDMVKVRLVGTISAGQPIEAIEEFETVAVPSNLISSAEHFALNVRGDSMIGDGIFDGDTVIIKKQNTAQDGDTVVALLNENEVTLKKIYRLANGFRLQPANPTMPPFIVKELIVQGKVVSVMRSYDKRKSLDQISNLTAFSAELTHFIVKIQEEIKSKFHANKEFDTWKKTEEKPDQNKFFLETSYTFLNEILLLWVCKDKKLLNFEIIKDHKQLSLLKSDAQKIYAHIFSSNIFDWYIPENFLLQEVTNLFNKYDFTLVDRDILGKLYEQFITREERKKLGQFYTPESVIDYILDQIEYTKNIDDKKIIDISCGSGGFTTRATNRLINKLKNNTNKKEVIEKVISNVYGMDINPFACYLAETNMLIQLLDLIVEVKKENPKYIIPKLKIFQTNSMETPSLLSNDEQEVKDIKNKTGHFIEGFDFVVGNPPYLEAKKMDIGTKKLCIETCPNVANGAFDLFVCFIDKGLRLLKTNGKLGYIFPNKFLIANYAKKMREELLDKYTIKEIIDVSECEIFENVSVYPVIMVIQNKKPQENLIKTAEKVGSIEELNNKSFITTEIEQATYKRDDLVFFILPSDKKQNSILTNLLSDKYKTLDNYLSLKWTISFHATGLREKFLFPEKPNSLFSKKLIGGKSFAGNDDINRYNLKWGGWWINYDEELARKHKNQLPPKSLFEQEKIIICQNSLRLRATYDNENYYCKDTFFVGSLLENKKSNFELKFFLAILNSKLLHFYYGNIYKGTHIAGGYLHYLIGYLYSLPVAEPTKKQQSDIAGLVDKILKVKDKEEYDKLDSKIDESIYGLYKIDQESRKIIESFI